MKEVIFVGKREVRHFSVLARALLLGWALLWTSCTGPERGAVPSGARTLVPHPAGPGVGTRSGVGGHTVVLVAIDGVRREDVFQGVDRDLAEEQHFAQEELIGPRELTPNMHALMQRGATLGAPGQSNGIAASGPNFISVPGYMEMMTGRRPTGCLTNRCDPTTATTLADDFARLPGSTPLDVAVIAAWEGVGRAAAVDPSRVTISVGRTRGQTRDNLRYDAEASALLDAGEKAGPKPGKDDFRRDRETADIALRYLSRFRPRFVFLGLGETDEYAHADDYRGYLQALTRTDQIIGEVMAQLSEYEREGRHTTLLVTTDHGRSSDFRTHGEDSPESAQVFLIAAGHGILGNGVQSPPEERHLADVATTIRSLAGVGESHVSSVALVELLLPAKTALASHP